MPDNILQSLTNNIIFVKGERDSLKKLSRKIIKVPKIIKIPTEYLTNFGDKK